MRNRFSPDYVEKLANNIEDKINMNDKEISNLSSEEFRSILKHKYFRQKKYTEGFGNEPTRKQMDVLNDYYGIPPEAPPVVRGVGAPKRKRKPVLIPFTTQVVPAEHKYYYKGKRKREVYVENVRRNKIGRWIDARTGRFVSFKNKK